MEKSLLQSSLLAAWKRLGLPQQGPFLGSFADDPAVLRLFRLLFEETYEVE